MPEPHPRPGSDDPALAKRIARDCAQQIRVIEPTNVRSRPNALTALPGNIWINGEFPSFTLHRYLVYAWWRGRRG